jgi:hypothetical protein
VRFDKSCRLINQFRQRAAKLLAVQVLNNVRALETGAEKLRMEKIKLWFLVEKQDASVGWDSSSIRSGRAAQIDEKLFPGKIQRTPSIVFVPADIAIDQSTI